MNYYEKKGISQSFLKKWAVSPAHALIEKKSDSMDYGRLLHMAILQPELLEENYIIEPDELMQECSTRAVKKYKDWKESQEKEVIKIDDWQKVQKSIDNFNQMLSSGISIDSVPLQHIFEKSEKEKELFCEYGNEILKGLADMVYINQFAENVIIADIKTTSNIFGLHYEIEKWKYYWQLPYYEYIFKKMYLEYSEYNFKLLFFFVENSEPFFWQVVELSEMRAVIGKEQIFKTLDDYILRKDDTVLYYNPEVEEW